MMETSSTSASVNNNDEEKHFSVEKMETDNTIGPGSPPPRVPSPMITVEDDSRDVAEAAASCIASGSSSALLTPTRDRKKSSPGPGSAAPPRTRKRSQPVRGDLLPDPDKLLSYKHHDKKDDEELEDPTVPGGHPKPPPEPRQAGQPAERKRSTVTFCPVIKTIDK